MSAEERFMRMISRMHWSFKPVTMLYHNSDRIHAIDERGVEKYRIILPDEEVIKFVKHRKFGFTIHKPGMENKVGRILLTYAKLVVLE